MKRLIMCAVVVLVGAGQASAQIVSWGWDYYGQVTDTPTGTGFKAIASGRLHSLALKSDGSIVSWGYDGDRQVRNTPSGTDFTEIAGGQGHSLALKSDGSIVSWGWDPWGIVTDTPSGTDFRAIAGGNNHSLALKSDGSIVSWGNDIYWQVTSTPSGTDFTAIAGGEDHSLALRSDGSIVSWGDDWYGQVTDTPTGTGFKAIASCFNHSLALKSDGSIVSWGRDQYGQVTDTPSGTDFTAIAGGVEHSLALKSDGSIVSWGYDVHGQVTDTPSGTAFTAIAVTGYSSLALGGSDDGCQLDVEHYVQGRDSPWAGKAYGESPLKNDGKPKHTIAKWGCALTCLAMAMDYVFEDLGTYIDPDTLNTSMIDKGGYYYSNDNKDYVASVNFQTATRRVSAHFLHPEIKFNSPEKALVSMDDEEAAKAYLEDIICRLEYPVIVGVKLRWRYSDVMNKWYWKPTHYVLVTGKKGDDFTIHDPAGHGWAKKLSDYTAGFRVRGYVADPPNDISELDFSIVAGEDATGLRVVDPQGNVSGVDPDIIQEIPNSVYAIDSLDDDQTGEPAYTDLCSLSVFQPAEGVYTVEVIGAQPGEYTLSIDGFAIDGTGQPQLVISGIAGFGSISTFGINYDPLSGEPPTAVRLATFESTADDIMNGVALDMIDNSGIANSLQSKLDAAESAAENGQADAAINILEALALEVAAQLDKHLSQSIADILFEDAKALIASLEAE